MSDPVVLPSIPPVLRELLQDSASLDVAHVTVQRVHHNAACGADPFCDGQCMSPRHVEFLPVYLSLPRRTP